ncbi:MAG: antibiotic biosynthesis monooxygenase [Pseudomonadota bacterium]
MPTIALVSFPLDEKKAEEYKAAIKSILPETAAFKGAQKIVMLVDKDQPADVVVYEEWDSREHHQKYLAWRKERGDLDKVFGMLRADPSIKYYEINEF